MHNGSIGNEAKKFIFLNRTNQVNPRPTLREFQRQQASAAAEQIAAPAENFHGLMITGDQELENIRLGIRGDFVNNMDRWDPNRAAGLQIIDHSINERLRAVASREISIEKQQAGLLGRMFIAGRGFFRNVRGFFRGSTRDEIGTRVAEIFGESEYVDQKRINVAQQVWSALVPAQRNAVQASLITQGLALPPPPPVPPGVNPQVFHLSLASPVQLETVRRTAAVGGVNVFAPAPRARFFPGTRPVPPATLLDRLIQLGGVHAQEAMRRKEVTISDPERLQAFLDTLRSRHQNIFETVVEKILDENELDDLINNERAMALVKDLEFIFSNMGPAALTAELDSIVEYMPTFDEEEKEGKEPSREKKQLNIVKQICDAFPQLHKDLNEQYDKARALGQQLFDLNRRRDEAITATRAAGAGTRVDVGLKEIQSEINSITKGRSEHSQKIRSYEKLYLKNGRTLVQMLTTQRALPAIPVGGARDPYAQIRAFAGIYFPGAAAPALSDDAQLFGVTDYPPPGAGGAGPHGRPAHGPGVFENCIVNTFNDELLGEMIEEIKSEYYDAFKPKRKLKAEELHMYLVRARLMRAGNTNRHLATNRALLTVRRKQGDIVNRNLYMGMNQEAAEYLGGTTLGMRWLDRLKKRVISRFRPETMSTAQHVINSVSTDKEDKKLGAFYNMPPDVTPEEFRKLCDQNGLTKDSIARYGFKLRKALEKYQAQNPDFNIELYDRHGKILEDLVVTIQTVQEELEQGEIMQEAVAKGGNFEESLIEAMRAKAQARQERDTKLLEEIAAVNPPWVRWFKRQGLKMDWAEDYAKAREKMKGEKMSGGQKRELLASENMYGAAEALGTAYSAAEMYKTAKKGVGIGWRQIVAPSGKAVGRAASSLVSLGWNRVLKPTGRAARKLVASPFVLSRRVFDRVVKSRK